MEMILWILAGGLAGWAAITYLRYNEERGMIVSVIIGIAGGVLGGKVIAPMVVAAGSVPGEFSLAALIVALVTASAALAVGNLVHHRFGV